MDVYLYPQVGRSIITLHQAQKINGRPKLGVYSFIYSLPNQRTLGRGRQAYRQRVTYGGIFMPKFSIRIHIHTFIMPNIAVRTYLD